MLPSIIRWSLFNIWSPVNNCLNYKEERVNHIFCATDVLTFCMDFVLEFCYEMFTFLEVSRGISVGGQGWYKVA